MYPRPRPTVWRYLAESVAMMLACIAVTLLTGNPIFGLVALLFTLVIARSTRDKGPQGPKLPKDWQ